jgi:hypothetical protein
LKRERPHDIKLVGKLLPLLVLFLSLLATEPLPLAAEASTPREYSVKGAFLYNFVHFVDWPATAFASGHAPFTVGILGKNPFGSDLESLNGQSVKNRKLLVRTLGSIEEVKDCQLVFISNSERGRLHQILRTLQGVPVLTVSDMEGFAAGGGMIHFVTLEDKVRFEINLKEAQSASLKVSSQLLKLARDVIK